MYEKNVAEQQFALSSSAMLIFFLPFSSFLLSFFFSLSSFFLSFLFVCGDERTGGVVFKLSIKRH